MNLNQIITEEYTKLLLEKKTEKKWTSFESESNNNNKTYVYIPQGTDLTKANVVIYFHGDNGASRSIKTLTKHFRKANHPPNTIIVVPNLGRKRKHRKIPKNEFINAIKNELKEKNPDSEINFNSLHLMAFSAGGPFLDKFIVERKNKNLPEDMLHKSRITYLDATWGQPRTRKVLKAMNAIKRLQDVHIVTCTTCKKKEDKDGNLIGEFGRTYNAANRLKRWVKKKLKAKLNWTPVLRSHNWLSFPREISDKYRYDKTTSKIIPEPKLEPVQIPEPEPIQPSEPERAAGESFEDYMFDISTGEDPEYAGIRHHTRLEPETNFEDYMLDVATGEDPEYAGIRYDTRLPEPAQIPVPKEPIQPEDDEENEPEHDVITTEKLIKLVQEEFNQTLSEQAAPLIKVDIALSYEKDFSFYGNVLNQIRSIKGITIAKASNIGVMDIGLNKKMVLIHLKFMPDRPLYQYLTYLQMELKKIKDKDGDRIVATQIKGIPREIEI